MQNSVAYRIEPVAAAPAGGHVFSLYSCNLEIVLREGIFGVRDSLRGLSQIGNVRPGEALFLYCVDRRRLYHADWRACGRPFYSTTPLGWEGGLHACRLRASQGMPVVLSLPIDDIEREIHEREYCFGFDRASFKAAANYWLNDAQCAALRAHPGWRVDRGATAANRRQKQFMKLRGEALRPPQAVGRRMLAEQRLTLLLQKHAREMSARCGAKLRIVDTYRYQSSSNVLRGVIAEPHPALAATSILEAQGELDMLALARGAGGEDELWVFELKAGLLRQSTVEQVTRYLWPLLHHPAARGAARLRPVLVGAGTGRKLSFEGLRHPRIAEPLVLTMNPAALLCEGWWEAAFQSLDMRVTQGGI